MRKARAICPGWLFVGRLDSFIVFGCNFVPLVNIVSIERENQFAVFPFSFIIEQVFKFEFLMEFAHCRYEVIPSFFHIVKC